MNIETIIAIIPTTVPTTDPIILVRTSGLGPLREGAEVCDPVAVEALVDATVLGGVVVAVIPGDGCVDGPVCGTGVVVNAALFCSQ